MYKNPIKRNGWIKIKKKLGIAFKVIKNISSSTSYKKASSLRLSVCLSGNLRQLEVL